jgi:predicted HAD superfamily Cof-like phosphohydrolase
MTDWLHKTVELEAQNDLLRTQVEMLSKTNFDRVKEFHEKFIQKEDPQTPVVRGKETELLRIRLMCEELQETLAELGYKISFNIIPQLHHEIDLVKLGKELSDLLYVVYGTAVSYGLPIDDIFAEVHRSNMSKLGEDGNPVLREDGKILKGPNYTPPYLDDIVWGEYNEYRQ